MNKTYIPPVKDIIETLNKGWMTHDAMWFYHCLQKFGIDATNEVNCSAVRSMSAFEIRRMMKLLNMDKIATFSELKKFFELGIDIVKPDFMKFEVTFPEKNVVRWDMKGCFAFDGITKLGVIDKYRCGIFERVKGWLDTLGLSYTMGPDVSECMMHRQGFCYREFIFDFKD